MTTEWIRFGITAFCFVTGIAILYLSIFGTYHFRYALNRIHAAAMTDTLVLLLFVIGMVVAAGTTFTSLKILIAIVLQWCTSPLASHMMAKFEYLTDDRLTEYCSLVDRTGDDQGTETEDTK